MNKYLQFTPTLPFEENRYVGKKIMVVAGGPTTNKVNWEKLDYDYIWSCNNFYKNKNLKTKEIDLVVLGHTVNLNDYDLRKYLVDNETIIYFEQQHLRKQNTDEYINFREDFERNIGDLHVEYRQKDGVGRRLTAFAMCSGADTVYLVGHDGYTKQMKATHSFDGHDGLQKGATYTDYSVWYDAVINSFNYLNEIRIENGVKLYNLGEGHEENIGTEISKVNFPLTDNIKKIIGEQ